MTETELPSWARMLGVACVLCVVGIGCCSTSLPENPCDPMAEKGGCLSSASSPRESIDLGTAPGGTALAVDDTHVYWTRIPDVTKSATEIARVPKGGGNTTVVAKSAKSIGPIQVDDQHVYFGHGCLAGVSRVPKAGGSPMLLRTEAKDRAKRGSGCPDRVAHLALDATHVVWVQEDHATPGGARSFSVRRLPKTGGEENVLAQGQGLARSLRVDDTHAYYAQKKPTEGIFRIPKQGGTPSVVVEGFVKSFDLEGGEVVWVNDADVILAQPVAGSARTWIASTYAATQGVRATRSHVIWRQGARVIAAPRKGGDQILVTEEPADEGLSTILSLAARDGNAYWIGPDAMVRKASL